MRCSSRAGFHGGSKFTTTEAACRLRPTPPASVERKTLQAGSLRNFSIKAPRWRGNAVEVGPLARYIVGYAQNKPEFKEPADKLLSDLGVPLTALFSTLGRTAARALDPHRVRG